MLEQQQQLISAISTSRLRRGCALQEDNLAPRLESKTESPKVACFHAIFDLCLVFGWTLAHAPFSLSSLFPPRLPSSLPLPFHSFLRLLVFFPLLLFPSISLSPFGFFVYFFSTWGLSGTENAPHTGNNTSNRALNLRRGVKQKLWPLTPPPSFFFFLPCSGVRDQQPTISQPINPSDRTYWLWPFGITTVIWQNIVFFPFQQHSRTEM